MHMEHKERHQCCRYLSQTVKLSEMQPPLREDSISTSDNGCTLEATRYSEVQVKPQSPRLLHCDRQATPEFVCR